MKILIILIIGVPILILFYFSYLAYQSHQGTAQGLINNQLSPCPDSPNCINSEFSDDSAHFTSALTFQDKTQDEISDIMQRVIKSTGGEVTNQKDNYISAIYITKIFKFVDDFEVRIDSENNVIHFRSASRVGRSDLGANQKRIDKIKQEIDLAIVK